MRRRLFTGIALAAVLLAISAPVVMAECSSDFWPVRPNERLPVGYAFTATVTEASRDVDPPAGDPPYADFDWHVELALERIHRGRLPERLVYNGWDAGCHWLQGYELRTGDRIFVAAESLHVDALPRDPFGEVIVWKRTGGRWRFYADPLYLGSDKDYYPTAARTARTMADILRFVFTSPMPDTSTLPPARNQNEGDAIPGLALAFAGGLLIALKKSSSARRT